MARYDLSGNLIPEPEDTGAPAYRAPGPPPDLASGPSVDPPPYGQPPPAKEPAPWAGHPTPGLNAPLPNPNRAPVDTAPPQAPRPTPGGGWQAAPYDNLYQGNDSGRNAGVPQEVAALRWNWGAFFLPPMWCAAHGAPAIGYFYDLVGIFFLLSPFLFGPTWGILIFFTTAFLLFGTGVYLGACGNEIAWKNRIFDNGVDGFFQVQRSWTISSFAIALPLYAILFSAFSYQVVRASHRQQALIDRALAARAASETAPPPAAMPPRQVFQQNPQQPTRTIIYGTPPSMYGRSPGMYGRPNYADPQSQLPPSPYDRSRFPGGMVGRAPVTIVVTPRAPGAGEPQGAPGFQGAPNAQGAPSSEQPVSPPAGQYEQPAPSPEQNPAPQPAPYQNAPEQNAAPPQEPAQGAYPGLPPGQQ
jgi:hypothetical protein